MLLKQVKERDGKAERKLKSQMRSRRQGVETLTWKIALGLLKKELLIC